MQARTLTIITVVRDDPAGLVATRDSLAVQSWQDFEWLVADGGSEASTLSALSPPGPVPDWLSSMPDGGPFAGMDRALVRASGQYVLFLNAGDCLADGDVLSDLMPVLSEAPDLLYGDSLEDPGDGHMRRKRARHWRWAFYGMPAHHCALFYRRGLLSGLRLDQGYRIAGDYAFTLDVLSRASRIVQVNRVVARFAPGGLSRRLAALGRREQYQVRRRLLRMSAPKAGVIMLLQIVAGVARNLCPSGYAFWRF
ncbi:hypothetical protein CHU95_04315 [Niveispirillum lacus]|uniref:Glycosyltransferase 2-like domain-containing protein n=1 Tax=Niveispirillum lacus TaxID=1981099 RepID=A0A255Z6C3_9PROT|nr:glycosyltransferase [Niveispirillum lacus]OYQ36455.1 hypothetical protein CHU95_04315 [Niveispirillum lacus]